MLILSQDPQCHPTRIFFRIKPIVSAVSQALCDLAPCCPSGLPCCHSPFCSLPSSHSSLFVVYWTLDWLLLRPLHWLLCLVGSYPRFQCFLLPFNSGICSDVTFSELCLDKITTLLSTTSVSLLFF